MVNRRLPAGGPALDQLGNRTRRARARVAARKGNLAHPLADAWAGVLAATQTAATLEEAFAVLARQLRPQRLHAVVALFEGGRRAAVRFVSLPGPVQAVIARAAGVPLLGLVVDLGTAASSWQRLARGERRTRFLRDGAGALARAVPALAGWAQARTDAGPTVFVASLRCAGTPAGLLIVAGDGLTPADDRIASACAGYLALALERERASREGDRWRRTLDELAALQRVAQAVNTSLELDEVFDTTVVQLAGELAYSRVLIYLVERGRLVVRAQAGYPQPARELSLDEGVAGRVVRTGRAALVPDARADPDFVYFDPAVRQAVIVPLRGKHGTIEGVLVVESTGEPVLEEGDLMLLTLLSDQVAVAVENAQLYAETRRRVQQMHLVSQVGRELTSVLSIGDLIVKVSTLLEERFGYYYVALKLVEDGEVVTRGRRFQPARDPGADRQLPDTRERCDSGLIGWVVRRGEAALAPDVSRDERWTPDPLLPETRAALVLPLRTSDRLVGVLDIRQERSYALDSSDAEVLQALAGQLAVLVENAELYREIEQRAEEISSLLVVAAAISTPLELEVRLEAIAHHARRLVNADGCILYHVEAGRSRVVPLVSLGADGEPRMATPVHIGEGLTGRAIANGLPGVTDGAQEGVPGTSPGCAIAVPLITGNEVIGALTLYREGEAHGFGEREIGLLQSFAVQAALAIQNAELVETLRQRALSLQQAYDELAEARTTVEEAYQRAWLRQLLDDISELSLSTLNPDVLAERALATLLDWVGPAVGAISLYEEDGMIMRQAATRGLRPAALAYIVDLDCLPSRGPTTAGDIIVDESFGDRLRASGAGNAAVAAIEGLTSGQTLALATLVLVPLKARGKLIGLVHMVTTQPRRLTDAELTVLRLAADQLGLGVDNARLYHQVTDRNLALARVSKELESFTYSVSHDLKAPLRGIEGFTRALQEDYGERLDEDGRHYLDMVHSAAVHLSALIDDLLVYSRLERRQFALGPVDVRSILERLLADRCYEIDRRHIDVRVDLPFSAVWGEREGIGQLLANLIDNAITYTRQREQATIVVGGRECDHEHLLWVQDNGIGFDMQYHDKIFEMFQRLHRAEEYPGTGVGLAIAKKIAERLQGRLWAESVEGRGATFYFALPRND
jgi:signal transduction histidine kinase/putative methionine-R-sulfoxide reductase with GAF domain